ncbi:amino acid adenylation domain-containing protein [Yinghuangia aomiensis]
MKRLLAGKGLGGKAGGGIPARDRALGPAPLSYAQRSLWLHHQAHPGSTSYNGCLVVDLAGPLDAGALRTALHALVVRHELLRTVYRVADDGEPRQIVAEVPRLDVPLRDLSAIPADAWVQAADAAAAELASRPFDLAHDQPVRWELLRFAADRHALVQVVHHIAWDGGTWGVLSRDLAALYRATVEGTALPAVPEIQYADVAAWERARDSAAPEAGADTEGVAFWHERLASLPEAAELPADGPRPPVGDERGGRRTRRFAPELAGRLAAFATDAGTTPFTAALAAFAAVLRRHTGADDLPIGTLTMDRSRAEAARLIGNFNNTVVLRCDTAEPAGRTPTLTFRQLVGRTAETCSGAFAHQDVPFDRVLDAVRPARSPGRTPLFDVMFGLLAHELAAPEFPGVTAAWRHIHNGTTQFDLALECFLRPGSLVVEATYRQGLLAPHSVDVLLAHLEALLAAALDAPDTPLALLDAVAPPTRPDPVPVPDGGVAALIDRRIATASEAVAVIADRTLTYRELGARADEIRALLPQGALWTASGAADGRREPVIALALSRSADLPAALLAVLRAGAAYLPLDLNQPHERTALMLGDARPDAVLCDAATPADLPVPDGIPRVRIDGPSAAAAFAAPARPAPPGAAAYVIFTSGSTGRPKAVVGTQAALANRLWWGRGDAPRVRVAKSALAFIDGTTELLGGLVAGDTVVVADDATAADPAALAALVDRHRVQVVTVVPSLLATLLDTAAPGSLASVTTWISSGEALPAALADAVSARWPDAAIVNLYGCSEAAGDSLAHARTAAGSVPIGRPIANTRAYVLDAALRPVPDGVPGELYLAGTGLARGYLGRPAATAERFLPDPFAGPGTRMYRTGDRVRRGADGAVWFLGRTDQQVKIRGVRVEPGEVEARLLDLPGVARAAVAPVAGGDGAQALAAYLVPADGHTLEIDDVRTALAALVPSAMLPATFTLLAELPRNASGKVDRRALPRPRPGDRGPAGRAPADAREASVCALFADLLGVPQVGPDDDFFALGGHSLLAARLANRVRAVLGVEVSLADVFRAPTPHGLAAAAAEAAPARPPVRGTELPAPVPASFSQAGLFLEEQLRGPSAAYHLPLGLKLTGAVDLAALRAALVDVVGRHEALRTLLVADDGVLPVQRVLSPAEAATRLRCDVVDLATEPGTRLAAETTAAVARPFRLADDLPMRAAVFTAADATHLVLTLHHTAADRWSYGPLLADLAAAYTARAAGTAPSAVSAPALVTYAEYTAWQRALLGADAGSATDVAVRQLDFWSKALDGLPDEAALPADRPRPADPTLRGGAAEALVPPTVTAALRSLARAHGVGPSAVLQAGVAALLHRMGAGDDIALGVPVAGRTDEDLHDVVGLFVNTVVVRADLRGDPAFGALLDRVRDTSRAAFAHADVPFAWVVDRLAPPRVLGRHPLFQVSVAHHRADEVRLALPGIETAAYPPPTGAAMFDLDLRCVETDGDGIRIQAGYAADRFDHGTVADLLDRLVRLLADAAAAAGTPVSALGILTPDEHAALTAPPAAHPVPDLRVDERIAAQARATPEAVALVGPDGAEVRYRELLGNADRLAGLLAAEGIGAGAVVAVAVPRSTALVAALLGVLRSGAAYLPLDPEHPDARLADMLADAAPRCVVTTSGDAARFAGSGIRVIAVDDPAVAAFPADAAPPTTGGSPATAGDPAYVLYTSGSTGRPKGVVVSHRALANQLAWVQHAFPLAAGDRFLHKAPAGFDVAIWETFWPLAAGATVVVAEPGGQRDAAYLARLMDEQGVTAAHFVPPMLDALLAEWPPADPSQASAAPLRLLLCGGEALPPGIALRAAQVLGVRPHNTYGPTEAAITATSWTPPDDDGGADPRTVPIGAPVWNTGALVLDGRLAPVPAGVPGELYLTGAQLADGYLGRPGLTASRFTASPYGPPGSRMYRTGDLVRRRADGALEFLGRTDDQVKVRGVRIEPAEIEACLAAHPDVAAAVVAVRRAASGTPRLVAYAVPDPDAAPDTEALRAHLVDRLPEHLVPAVVVLVTALPLLPNGKTDRAALPDPAAGPAPAGPHTTPRTPEEAALAEVFAEVLGLPRVGVDDGFFTLGGDSIGATLLASRARTAGLPFTVRDVFRHPTVAALARTAAANRASADEASPEAARGAATAPGLAPEQFRALDRALGGAGVADVLPLSALQEGLLFHFLMDLADDTAQGIYTQQVVLDLDGPVDPAAMADAVRAVLEKYPNLRAGFVPLDDTTVQVIPQRWELPFRYADLTEAPSAAAAGPRPAAAFDAFAAAERDRPWDPARPPLIRFGLARTGDDRHRLVMTSQVLLIDGWSSGLVLTSLLAAYTDAQRELARPTTPFRTYLDWLRQRDADRSRAVWAAYLDGIAEPTRLAPAGHDADGVSAASAASAEEFVRTLPAGLTERLTARAREAGVTLGTVYECAWGLLLARLTGRDDCVFGALVSGRHPDVAGVETTVGLLFNTVPVRVRVRAGESPRALWRRVHDEKSELFDHPEPGLAELQAATGLGPLFDTFFVVQNLPLPATATRYGPDGALRVRGHEVRDATHYPVSMVVTPGAETTLRAMFHTGAFDRDEVELLADRFVRVMAGFADDPDAACARIGLLSPAEHDRALTTWNATGHDLPDVTVAELLEERAAAEPDAVALVFRPGATDAVTWTYRELNARANRIARLLAAHGAGPERVVALALPRTPDMVAALFAVLKTGAAYLPLELDLPAQRLALLLDDGAPVCVLTAQGVARDVPEHPTAARVLIDAPATAEHLLRLSDADPTDDERPGFTRADAHRMDHPAYIIYTSGTTGRPKGVVTPYRGLTNMQYNHRRHIFDPVVREAGRRLRIAHTVSFAFDMSWEELLWLVEGHEVHICDEQLRRDAHALTSYLDTHRIDVVNITPTYAQHLLDEGLLESRHRPCLVLLGGEAVSDTVWSALRDTPGVLGYNLYGPTEYTINTLGAGTDESTTPALGRPIHNTEVYVLDHHLRPVPQGTPGELYVAGAGLARAYHRNPAQTAARFVPNPFGPPGSRLYRTGDLTRHRPDGTLDYLGRTDHQTKIRGHRIEPTEIETVLTHHAEVTHSAVVPSPGPDGMPRLVAYVVADPEASAGADAAAEQLAEWQQIYDAEYHEIGTALFREDFAGWDSSYDGLPIPVEHMREWRDATVARIAGLAPADATRPRRILEIGVGTGLLLGRLAPDCAAYWATDFAAPVIAKLRRDIARDPELAAKVELRAQPAHDLSGLPRGFFDTVVVNSVAQYFPDAGYLTDVVRQALGLVVPGGAVFLGDLRDLRLARSFHTAIQLARTDNGADDADVRAAIERSLVWEKELLLDPGYFTALPSHVPGLAGVDVRIKRGRHHNELSRYRYDAVLYREADPCADDVATPSAPVPAGGAVEVSWADTGIGAVAALLDDGPADTVRVTGIPNARLAGEAAAARVLADGGSVAEARAARDAAHPDAVEPDALHELGARHGRPVSVTWSARPDGTCDAVFAPRDAAAPLSGAYAPGTPKPSLSAYTNNPAATREAGTLVPRLREYLRERLPDYMVPSAFVVLDRLPLTVNGKLDVRALPAPDAGARPVGRAPETAEEKAVCALFGEVLGVADVGADDDFFDLGGHSLLAARLAAKARSVLGVDLAIRDVFGAPTAAALAARMGPLADGDRAGARPVLAARPRLEEVPLSYAQRRLWLLGQFADARTAYHEPVAARLHGPLDRDALQAAVRDVAARHEALRTICVEAGEEAPDAAVGHDPGDRLTQRLVPVDHPAFEAEFVEVAAGSRAEAETRVTALISEAVRRPFDLAADPPLRVSVFTVAPDEHVLLSVFHHIVVDEWSIRPYAHDLAAAYGARRAGRAPEWAALPVQYADFTLWQRDLLGDPADPASRYNRQLAYWRNELSGIPQEIALPSDRPRPTRATYRGGTVETLLDTAVADRLRGIARSAGASSFMVMQSAVALLLHRMGAGDDIPLGSPVAGRDEEELAGLIGFFVNTVVARADVSGNPTFRDLLARLRDTDLRAFAHQDLPFERLVEALNPVRSQGRNPLFQVMVGYQNQAVGTVDFPGLRVEGARFTPPTAKFDLDFVFRETSETGVPVGPLEIAIEYASDLFDHATAERLLSRLVRVLERVAAAPDERIGSYDVLTPDEHRQVVAEWNATAHDLPNVTVAELLEERAAAEPDAVALVFRPGAADAVTWTYRELNARANRIARLLRAEGAGPERVVALGLPRTPDMVAALFAVLKTGAAYLPLELDLPAHRLALLIEDTSPVCVVGARSAADRLPDEAAALFLDDPDTATRLAALSDADPTDDERPGFTRADAHRMEHPAYIIYTSGTTGRPKGVVTPYRGLTNMQYNHRRHIFDPVVQEAGRRLRIAHTVSFAFDMSWEELLWLVEGHEVHICDEQLRRDAHALTAYLDTHHIDVVNITPTYAAQLVELGLLDAGHRPCLVLLGGEAVGGDVWSALRETPGVLGYNLYGPTEYTINTLGAGTDESTTPALGRPIHNTEVYVLDEHLRPVPPGVPGELYVSGAGLARAYHRAPAQTAARFVPNPFRAPGTRLYRTGDLTRHRPDGTLDYLGRTDHQTKIRGHRIEPTEIETVLTHHPDVAQAAVVPTADRLRLVAYVVGAVEPAALRAWSAERLPDYMVPSAVVPMDVLPLTVNGKLDRDALPEPDLADAVSARGPRDEDEAELCRIFAAVLGLPRVGVDDDFFALGGHSLLAVRLVSLIRGAGLSDDPAAVTVATVLTATTPAALAARLRDGRPRADAALAPLLALRPDGALPPLFCVHPGFGLAWPYAALLPYVEPERPVYGLQSPVVAGAEPAAGFAALAAEYLARVRRVQPRGPYHLLGWSFGGEMAFALAALLREAGEDVRFLAVLDAQPPAPLPSGEGRSGADGFGTDAALDHLARAVPGGDADVLTGLGDDVVARLIAARRLHEFLAPEAPLPAFDGDVLCVVAEGNARHTGAAAWRDRVTGTVSSHEVPYHHDDLLSRDAVGRIGPLLRDALAHRDTP